MKTNKFNQSQQIEENKKEIQLPSQYQEDIDKKLKEISQQVELIGKVCDYKMAQSYEEYHNTIKSSKAQLWDDLTKLNFKLIEYNKQNTKEDYINKLKQDLKLISNQVQAKDKELNKNEKELTILEKKVLLMDEEKLFLDEEIKKSKTYNEYLKSVLYKMEDMSEEEIYNNFNEEESILNNEKEEETSKENQNNDENEEEKLKKEKLELYLMKKKEIYDGQIFEYEDKIKTKMKKLKMLETFKNPVLNLLFEKTIDYIDKIKDSKIKKLPIKELFFEKKEGKHINNNSINDKSDPLIDAHLLHKRDKREIVKEFLNDELTKRLIYSLLYNEDDLE